ncbi:Six-hairpin glycosidase [Ramaria rubella]|nr:Six-hairpin glycosidase [Ramaria rubella]
MYSPLSLLLIVFFIVHFGHDSQALANDNSTVNSIRSAMLASIRTSWEQGTAAGAIIETDCPDYSVFADAPFESHGFPAPALQLALSAAVRQTPDGRLSQNINDAEDGAALDGASAGSAVLLGTITDPPRKAFWQNAADAELNFVLNVAPRTSTGAISHRVDSKEYWADGVYMGFPFIAAYGAITSNQSLLMEAYTQCRLYRDALLQPGPTGPLWAHILDDNGTFIDPGLWATGNAWAALGMLRVQSTLLKSPFASSFFAEIDDLTLWIKEILDGTFAALTSDDLVPDYIQGGPTFGDAASSAALASVAFRSAVIHPSTFGSKYTDTATKIRNAVIGGVDDLGVISPLVNPLIWTEVGILSTEGQAFGLMLLAAETAWMESK